MKQSEFKEMKWVKWFEETYGFMLGLTQSGENIMSIYVYDPNKETPVMFATRNGKDEFRLDPGMYGKSNPMTIDLKLIAEDVIGGECKFIICSDLKLYNPSNFSNSSEA